MITTITTKLVQQDTPAISIMYLCILTNVSFPILHHTSMNTLLFCCRDVVEYCEAIANTIRQRGVIDIKYSIATEHEHSCCVLLAREDKFLIKGRWHTWIDYDKFNLLIDQYNEAEAAKAAANETKENSANLTDDLPFSFTSTDYMVETPEWAVYKNNLNTKGFDPEESRWKRTKTGKMVEIDYKSSESGCG
jgi:hypothetical protein